MAPDNAAGGPRIRVVAAALLDGPRVLVALRGPAMSTPGLWELPGGKVEPGESDAQALAREIAEELDARIEVLTPLGTSETPIAGRTIVMAAYTARLVSGTPTATEHAELRWIGADAIELLDWAPADRPLLAALRDTLLAEGRTCS